jgi:ribosomal protein L17
MMLNEEYFKAFRYDFKEEEYDALAIKNQCIKNLQNAKEDPFAPLVALKEDYYKSYVHQLVLDLIAKSIELQIGNTDEIIREILSKLTISFQDTMIQAGLIQSIKKYAKNDLRVALVILEYAIGSIEHNRREYLWYLKWLESYILLFNNHHLKRNSLFDDILNEFLKIQKKKKFKSMNAAYTRFLKLDTQ